MVRMPRGMAWASDSVVRKVGNVRRRWCRTSGGSVPREYEGRKCVTADGECSTETEKGACGESAGGKLPESEATALQAGVQVELRVAFRTMARRNPKDGTASGSRVEEAALDVHLKDCGV